VISNDKRLTRSRLRADSTLLFAKSGTTISEIRFRAWRVAKNAAAMQTSMLSKTSQV
jgi:hypothetical protein